ASRRHFQDLKEYDQDSLIEFFKTLQNKSCGRRSRTRLPPYPRWHAAKRYAVLDERCRLMTKTRFIICGIVLALCAVCAQGQAPAGKAPGGPPMVLTSSAFADGTDIPAKYTQVAGDAVISPELNWTNVP